jgi:hypothetical protein
MKRFGSHILGRATPNGNDVTLMAMLSESVSDAVAVCDTRSIITKGPLKVKGILCHQ